MSKVEYRRTCGGDGCDKTFVTTFQFKIYCNVPSCNRARATAKRALKAKSEKPVEPVAFTEPTAAF